MKLACTSIVLLSLIGAVFTAQGQSTSWKGTESDQWRNDANWTNGAPDSFTDANIGDAYFTGSHQPVLASGSKTGNCKNLILGAAAKVSALEIHDALYVTGSLIIGASGTLMHGKNHIYISGDFINSGSYTASDKNRRVYMLGANQTLGGSSATIFEQLYINSGSTITLNANIVVNETLDIGGTLNPTENYTVSGTGNIDLSGMGTLIVMAPTFSENYTIAGNITFNSNSATIDYASSSLNQTVDPGLSYRNLRISGGMAKSLTANTTIEGDLVIDGGTLDILSYSINRSSSGGYFSLATGATLKIGGTQSFPANYATHIISLTSTVHYSGANQIVSNELYGNLTISSSGGSIVKTLPESTLMVAGNFTSSVSAGTLSFTAGNNITVLGNITLGSGTTFNGSTYSHKVSGNVFNHGTYNGAGGTFTSNGSHSSWSGLGTYNMGNMVINGANTTLNQHSSFTLAGSFSTATSGMFTHSSGGAGIITMTGAGKTISGSGIVFDDLTIGAGASITNGSSYTVAGNLTVSGSLTDSSRQLILSGSGKSISGTGTLQLYDLTITGSLSTTRNLSISRNLNVTGSFNATAGTITFNGTSGLSGAVNLFNITVANASTLSMSVNAILNISGTDALTGTGTFNGTSHTPNMVGYNSSSNQTINFTAFHHLTVSNGGTKTPAAALTVNGDLTIGSATTLEGSSYAHILKGNWVNNGTFTANTSNIQLTGAYNSTITGATTFSTLTINKGITEEVTLKDNVSAATVNMTAGIIQTGANTLTITGTRTGNGIILGTIRRQHSFVPSTDYTFEGPNNIVRFTSIIGVITAITVSVDTETQSTFPFRESINREYDISVTGIAVYTASLRLHYETVDLNGNIESNMDLWNDQGTSTWINKGRNTNNTTDNWVEKTGLTSLANKWSLSDGLKVLSWTGAVSSLITDPANWTVTAGSPSIRQHLTMW